MERAELKRAVPRVPIRSHRHIDSILRRFVFRQLANRFRLFTDSGADRVLAHVRRRTLFIGRCVCSDFGNSLRDACRAFPSSTNRKSKIKNRKLNGGGGGIRTHEAFRPAGFQDRSHKPLDHPSRNYGSREVCHSTEVEQGGSSARRRGDLDAKNWRRSRICIAIAQRIGRSTKSR